MAGEPKEILDCCPNCGADDLVMNDEVGKIQCLRCKNLFDGILPSKMKISESENEWACYRCSVCGAEVCATIDDDGVTQCHWCGHIFALNEKIESGNKPGKVLPFKVSRDSAIKTISERVLSMLPDYYEQGFREQFDVEQVRGAYLPYLVVNEEMDAAFTGKGQKTLWGDSAEAKGVARVSESDVKREFDFLVNDLMVESLSKKLKAETLVNIDKLINALLPFDLENAVDWNEKYAREANYENCSDEPENVDEKVEPLIKDLAKMKLQDTVRDYNLSVKWTSEELVHKKTEQRVVYLPVWLYVYRMPETKRIYYAAVNGRTGAMAGVLPLAGAKEKKPVRWRLYAGMAIIGLMSVLLSIPPILLLGSSINKRPLLFAVVGGVLITLSGLLLWWWNIKNDKNVEQVEKLNIEKATENELKIQVKDLKKQDLNETIVNKKTGGNDGK